MNHTMTLLTQLAAERKQNEQLKAENRLLKSGLQRMIARCKILEARG